MASSYGRKSPPLSIVRHHNVPLVFQIVDLDYVQQEDGVRIRLFGTTMDGHSVCCSASTYVSYFYVTAPKKYANKSQLIFYQKALNNRLMEPQTLSRNHLPATTKEVITNIEEVRGASVMNYTKDTNQLMLKISIVCPKLMTQCRKHLFDIFEEPITCFEANIDFEVCFMADYHMVGCCWIEVPANQYNTVRGERESQCQIEVETRLNKLIIHQPDEEPYGDIAPLRVLSFDIECASDPGVFPTPDKYPVIQIGCICKEQNSLEPFDRVCFTQGGCDSVSGSRIVSCKDEKTLLKKWAEYICEVDPDIITGYNIQNFDFSYLVDRAKHLKISPQVLKFSRLKNAMCRVYSSTFASNQMGKRVNKQVDLDGRIVFDVYQVILRDYKLRSYTLNNVSYHFLNEQKEDVEPNKITPLFYGTDQDRRRLAIYCLKDAELPLKLLDKLMLIVNYVEMARVTGVPMNFLTSRGQQVRILSKLLRKAKATSYFLPVIEHMDTAETYEGATVIEPVRGFYKEPIATLDFASLYPSIMIAHNLCYTTCLPRPPPEFVENEDYIVTPTNNYFVTPKLRRGLLPEILEELIAARKKVKIELKNATDPLKKMVLNGRQLAIKITANSVYGFTGATVGKLPCLEISQSVTGFGRQMIDMTKKKVEASYKRGMHGMTKDAKVIYGDTDSVMVDFGVETVAEAMKFGSHAANLINENFPPPIKLEFEKVYCPYLLIQKKRYAGLYFTRPEIHDKIDTKGMETVRRDNCPLVGSVMNTCLELLLIDRDPIKAMDYARNVISDLLRNQVDISMLIISKELTKTDSEYQGKQAHAVLAERMRKRDAGSAPKLGDRVPYVIVAKGAKVPAFEKAEDPLYVLKNRIPIDTNYYLQNQLLKPLCRLFDPVINDKAEMLFTQGEHARVRVQAVSKTVGLGMFAVKKETCISCKCVLVGEKPLPLCQNCDHKFTSIYMEKMEQLRLAQHRFGRLWTECQNCASTLSSVVECGANDCPIFYMREKARVDLDEKLQVVTRFNAYNSNQLKKD